MSHDLIYKSLSHNLRYKRINVPTRPQRYSSDPASSRVGRECIQTVQLVFFPRNSVFFPRIYIMIISGRSVRDQSTQDPSAEVPAPLPLRELRSRNIRNIGEKPERTSRIAHECHPRFEFCAGNRRMRGRDTICPAAEIVQEIEANKER